MLKRILLIVGICGVVFLGIWKMAQQQAPTVESDTQAQTETAVQGVKATATPTATPTPTQADPTPTALTNQKICTSLSSSMKKKANEFMTAHTAHDSSKVLSLMSDPESDDETIQYNFLTGIDSDTDARLYVTTPTSYKTTAFTLGSISYSGPDMTDRGDELCTMTISETRLVESQDQFSQTSVTRYMDFTVLPDMSFQIQAFKDGKKGTKYSGFN